MINGLPVHPLLVHAVVVLIPLTAAMAVLGSLWPAAQRKFGVLTPLAALAVVILVPITVQAGEQLAAQLGLGASIAEHSRLARRLLPLAVALLVTTAGQWAYLRFAPQFRQSDAPRRTRWLTLAIALCVIAASTAATVQVVLTAEAGARSVWGSVA